MADLSCPLHKQIQYAQPCPLTTAGFIASQPPIELPPRLDTESFAQV
jgi:hypothetical protein